MRGARPLDQNEVKQVADLLNPRDKALFLLGIYTGLRISELLSLTVADIRDPVSFVVRKELYLKRKNTKGKTSGRSIPIHPQAQSALLDWLRVYPQNHWVGTGTPLFLSAKTRQVQGIPNVPKPISRVQAWRILNSAFIRTGLAGKLGTHALRKTFAKGVYERSGKDLLVTQKALGHTAVSTTVDYLSFNDQDVRDAILGA